MKIQKYILPAKTVVEAVQVNLPSELLELRASDWHDGQLRVLTFPTAPPQGYVGPEGTNDVGTFGRAIAYGNYLVKGPAGDIEPVGAANFESTSTLLDTENA